MSEFPEDFIWGTATSAYQIEGAADQGGRGRSVWDDFCLKKGKVFNRDTGLVACDHYHEFTQDVKLLSQLGVMAYRFSISWSRVLPTGEREVNPVGLDFYDRLVDELLEAKIEPWVTLFHWDFPVGLYYQGGWLNRDSSQWFSDYTSVVAQKLSDRVSRWITINEPQCYIGLGHYAGVHAPGLNMSRKEVLLATHHTLMAHGRSVQTLRADCALKPEIGFSPVGWVSYPAHEDEGSIEAARKTMFRIYPDRPDWYFNNAWYSDPVFLGNYPQEGLEAFQQDVPDVQPGDMEIISQPLNFYGVNIYHGAPITNRVGLDAHDDSPVTYKRTPGYPQTLMGWTIDPESLYWGIRFLYERYKLPVYITENGVASLDWLHCNGEVSDPARIDFMNRYLGALRRALMEDLPVKGYFYWSLMDNFEWELGYSKRFGLVYVDYQSLERIPKKSYQWYRSIIESRGQIIPEFQQFLK